MITKVIAHRGNFFPEGPIPEVQNKYKIPENTLEAFERAFKKGWGIETDIRLAGDRNFVVTHDSNIVRFSGKSGSINQMSVPQILEIGYKDNSAFRIPTLDGLCQLVQRYAKDEKMPFIAFQVKRGSAPDSGVVVGRAVAQQMEKYGLKDSILFDATFEEAQVLRNEFPWLNLSISVVEKNYSSTIYTPKQALSSQFTKVFNCVWADEWKEQERIYNKDMFARFRQSYSGRIDVVSPELHYNEQHSLSKDLEGLKKLWSDIMSWGTADGICTDYPSELQKLL